MFLCWWAGLGVCGHSQHLAVYWINSMDMMVSSQGDHLARVIDCKICCIKWVMPHHACINNHRAAHCVLPLGCHRYEVNDRLVQGLSALFLALRRRPIIRYQRSSEAAKRLAEGLYTLTYKQQVILGGSACDSLMLEAARLAP